jgi:hypothetical protein
MDTLLEANKHASLMRRRDQLRQFPTAQLQCNSAITQRACGWAPLRPGHLAVRRMPLLPAPVQLPLAGEGCRFVTPASARGSAAEGRSAEKAGVRMLRRPLLLAPRVARSAAAISQAGFTKVRFRLTLAGGKRRGTFNSVNDTTRLQVPDVFHSLGVTRTGGLRLQLGRGVSPAAKVGNPFRVSAASGFRRPSLSLAPFSLPAPECQGMAWPDSLPLRRQSFAGTAAAHGSPAKILQSFPLQLSFGLALSGGSGLRGAAALAPRQRPPYENRLNARAAGWTWTTPEEQQLRAFPSISAAQSVRGPGCVPVKLRPAAVRTEHRVEQARFQPSEQPWITAPSLWNATR